MSATVSATRELFGNPGLGGQSWAGQHAVLLAVVWPADLLAAARVVAGGESGAAPTVT